MKLPADALLAVSPPARAAAPLRGRGYSRFVQLAKRLLPAAALGLLLLAATWPRLQEAVEGATMTSPRLDLSEARDLRMVKVRYTGIDRQNRPFVITAAVARQTPKVDQLISLEEPKADLTTLNGEWIELSSYTGLYQPQPQLLDLFGNVVLYQDKGNEFHSDSAHIDMAAGTAEGDEPTTGQGPFGYIKSDGFRILDRGATIIFKGHAFLELDPRPSGAE